MNLFRLLDVERAPRISVGLASLALITCATSATADVFNLEPGVTSLEFVSVGNAGNAPDPDIWEGLTPADIGAVDYEYRIGKHEVTNAQYAAFLNAIDPDGINPNDVYNPEMGTNFGGIDFFGENPGGEKYVVRAGRENNPVSYVSWFDAARFVNWLNGGQGDADTESGVYTLTGPQSVTGGRAVDATYFIPSENEWYKAAYHQPAADGGDADDYWLYPTMSNVEPGNDIPNGANYFDEGFVATQSDEYPTEVSPFTDVGTFAEAPSFYGTFDQGGNVSEWIETVGAYSSQRVVRGGSWDWTPGLLQAYARASTRPLYELSALGFRIAAIAEPRASMPGDMNCDGHMGFDDINSFVLAISGHDAYTLTHPDCNWWNGDMNADGTVDFADINGFVSRLSQ